MNLISMTQNKKESLFKTFIIYLRYQYLKVLNIDFKLK